MPENNFQEALSRISALTNPQVEETAPADTGLLATTEADHDAETAEADTQAIERYKVKIGDAEEELTLDDLKLGYMRNADYERKMQGSRKLRESMEAATKELSETLNDAKSLIELELKELETPEMKELREDDPAEYWRKVDQVNKKAEKFKALKEAEIKKLNERHQEMLRAEKERLAEAIPDWLDPDKQAKESKQVLDLLSKVGYSDDDINRISDHRMFVLARKAALYDQLINQDLSAKKVNKPPKSAKPGTGEGIPRVTKARETLKQTGHIRDAAKAIRELLK